MDRILKVRILPYRVQNQYTTVTIELQKYKLFWLRKFTFFFVFSCAHMHLRDLQGWSVGVSSMLEHFA